MMGPVERVDFYGPSFERVNGRNRNAGVDEIALPRPRRAAVEIAVIAGGREIQHSVGRDRIDGLRNDAVLEHSLVIIENVVDDDFASRRGKALDVGRELSFASKGCCEPELGPWREVVNDLQHG